VTEINQIFENIQKSNYNKFEISTLVIFLNKSSDKELLADYMPLIYDIARISGDKGLAFESLMLLISCHNSGYRRSDICETIVNLYFTPYKANFEKVYINNISLLKKYEHIQRKDFPDFEELTDLIMPLSSIGHAGYIKYDKSIERFDFISSLRVYIDSGFETNIKPGQRNILCDVYDVEYILNTIKKTHYENSFSFLTPSVLYYESFQEFLSFLQTIDFSQIIDSNRSIFIFGAEEIEAYLLKPEVIIDGLLIAQTTDKAEKHGKIILPIFEKKEKHFLETQKKLNDYYSNLSVEKIIEKIKNKTVRIGFMVSKWTTALQYYVRDYHEACKNLGITSDVMSEKDYFSLICGSNRFEMVEFIYSFKPDIIFIIDHFRREWPVIPPEIIFVCWIQDFMPYICSAEACQTLTEKDFILNGFPSCKRFFEYGYTSQMLIEAPQVFVNKNIYKTYELTQEEFEKYKTDICVISNSGNYIGSLETLLEKYKNFSNYDLIKKICFECCERIYDEVYKEKSHYYQLTELENLFAKISLNNGLNFSRDFIYFFHTSVVLDIYKSVPIMWLHERGYNMKLWGRAWSEHQILKKYAMGVASNGEVLSKILNASKISLGLNLFVTGHPRLSESILSDSLYIANHLPPENDNANIRNYLKPGKEILFFKNRNDLYKKIDYYLNPRNDDERKSIIENGKNYILNNFTYESFFLKLLEKITQRFEGQENGVNNGKRNLL